MIVYALLALLVAEDTFVAANITHALAIASNIFTAKLR
jgi:hypothetical protein